MYNSLLEHDGHNENVFLLAEDNPVDAEIVRAMLDEAYDGKFSLVCVDQYSEIAGELAKQDFDLLILDMNLPDSTGSRSVTLLRDAYPGLPIVVLTGQTDLEIAVESLKLGAQDFLTKNDITPPLLARSFYYAKERRKTEQALQQSLIDIADRNEQLNQLAYTDHLTKLPNRTQFEAEINHRLQKAQAEKKQFALLYLDLNNFKTVNDNFGHIVGDELLIQVAKRLQITLDAGDFIARMGGDEFLIFTDLIDSSNKQRVDLLIENILSAFEAPFAIDRKEIQSQPAIGVAFFPEAYSAELLMKHADCAMYEVKANPESGQSVRFYTGEMEEKYNRKVMIAAQLDQALKQDEFDVFFQSIEDIHDPNSLNYEALLRWNSQLMGPVRPEEFIPVFEDSPIINQLTKIVLKKSQRLINALDKSDVNLASIKINVTASQLSSANFSRLFLSWLDELSLSPNVFCLELTERQMVKNVATCINQIEELRDAGVKIALDDFGAGYSSIKLLLEFAIDYLKLDMSLIKDIEKHRRNQALVSGIIEIGHRMGMKVVAEGVETLDEYQTCKKLKCDMIQGYYLHRPEPQESLLTKTLESQTSDKTRVDKQTPELV